MLRAEGGTSRQFLSPAKGLAVVLLLLVLAGAGILITQQGAEDDLPPTGAESNNFALTDTEAIARFEELQRLAHLAARNRDLTLIPQAFTSDGPARQRATTAIHRLLDDKVIDHSVIHLNEVTVISNGQTEVQVRERSRLRPCFLSEKGIDITDRPFLIEQVGIWTLRPEAGIWRVHDIELIRDREVRKLREPCS